MMNKLFYILSILVFVLSCQNKSLNYEQGLSYNSSSYKKNNLSIPLSIDTLFFDFKDENKWKDYAIVYCLDKKKGKNDLVAANFKVEFFENKSVVFIDNFIINGYDEGSDIYGSYVLDSIQSNFKDIIIGYPACGYTSNHNLFYIKKNESSKVYSWHTNFDGGWYDDVVFFKINDKKFSVRKESFWPDDNLTTEEENSNEEIGQLEYSDSIVFTYSNNKWKKQPITPKGKVYYSKIMTFDEMNGLEE